MSVSSVGKNVERRIWSDETFDEISWHDVHIHGIACIPDRFEFCLDIDYLVEWRCPPPGHGPAQFLVAPATLVFENVSGVVIGVNSQQGLLTISEVRRERRDALPGASVPSWQWLLKCEEGEITFRASGFHLVLRLSPVLSDVQCLGSDRRGLPSFDGRDAVEGSNIEPGG
jgi:hypothetical protein